MLIRIILLTIGVLLACWILSGRNELLDWLLDYTPKNWKLAVCILLLLYACKSFVLVIPVLALQISAAQVLSPGTAMIVNLCGVLICFVISYLLGHLFGMKRVAQIIERLPKAAMIVELSRENGVFSSFGLRLIRFVDDGLTSLYLGAAGVPFAPYLAASLAGVLPKVILNTLVGSSLHDPGSPVFLISLLMSGLLMLLSFGLYKKYRNRTKKGESGDAE